MFVYSRNKSGPGSTEIHTDYGIFEGLIKVSSDREKSRDVIRFPIGNQAATDRFIKMYEQQSSREGRTKSHHNMESGPGSRKKDPFPTPNFIALDAEETERQRKKIEMLHQSRRMSRPSEAGLAQPGQRMAPGGMILQSPYATSADSPRNPMTPLSAVANSPSLTPAIAPQMPPHPATARGSDWTHQQSTILAQLGAMSRATVSGSSGSSNPPALPRKS
jgi:hypothetical protein